MKGLLRIILNSLTIVSLLLCVATAGLWVWSYWRAFFFEIHTSQLDRDPFIARKIRLGVSCGDIKLNNEFEEEADVGPAFVAKVKASIAKENGTFYGMYADPGRFTNPGDGVLGFGYYHLSQKGPRKWGRQTEIKQFLLCPLWFPTILAATLPLIWLVRRVRRLRRIKASQCARCGYDLRATPDRCPECGTAVPQTEPKLSG